eukprot:17858-Prymnesium_polylepis.1
MGRQLGRGDRPTGGHHLTRMALRCRIFFTHNFLPSSYRVPRTPHAHRPCPDSGLPRRVGEFTLQPLASRFSFTVSRVPVQYARCPVVKPVKRARFRSHIRNECRLDR